MEKQLLSVGIDLGTSTTQLIFSRIYLTDAAMCAVPDVHITKKEIIYRSDIYFTPLKNREEIDLPAVEAIVQREYAKAGVQKGDISTGAVIITGETARKENAAPVAARLAAFAGDFVVATAGPDLESVLAGYGSGAAERSKHVEGTVVNFDIGGGTTNAAVFNNGQVVDTFACDIGGRLIRINGDNQITYVSERIQPLLQEMGISVQCGDTAELTVLQAVTDAFARVLLDIFRGKELSAGVKALAITALPQGLASQEPAFSGGVGECVYADRPVRTLADVTRYGDIGPLLGQSIRHIFNAYRAMTHVPQERMRATVIGAGSHSLRISGSTVYLTEAVLPLQNIPVVYVPDMASQAVTKKLQLFPDGIVALALQGQRSPSYTEVKQLAHWLSLQVAAYCRREKILVILIEADFAKALGMTLQRFLPDMTIISLDNIKARDGDYVDIGKPVSSVVPVVVKTLIFTA